MNFWKVSVLCDDETKDSFIVKSPYTKPRTKEILLSVHPEYKKMSLKKVPRPSWCKPWEGECL